MQIDTSYSVATPEGISLHLTPAGPVSRLYAWAIDVFIRLIIYIGLGILAEWFGKFGSGIAMIIIFFIEWFYPVLFEVFRHGQTPGKKMFRIYVAQESGAPVTFGASMVRNVIRFIDFFPLFYGFAFVSMLLTDKFQRLGDLAANTVVLYLPEGNKENKGLVNSTRLDDISTEHPPFSFTLKEQQALINFSSRIDTLNNERSDELARLTGKLVAGQEKPADYLYGIANSLLGKKASVSQTANKGNE